MVGMASCYYWASRRFNWFSRDFKPMKHGPSKQLKLTLYRCGLP